MQGEILNKQLEYWNQILSGAPQKLDLPTDRPRLNKPILEGSFYSITLDEKIVKEIKKITKRYNVTPFMVLLAVFQLLLSRYSNQEDIIIGMPIANRHYPKVGRLIGFFVNTLIIRLHCKRGKSFKQLLNEVRQQTLEAYDYQDVSFEQIVDHLKVPRNSGIHPIFQVMFVMENLEPKEVVFEGLKMDILPSNNGISKFDLTLIVKEKKDSLELFFEYSKALFDETTIIRMARHYRVLLENSIKNSEVAMEKLPLMSNQERNKLLAEWNNTNRDYSKDKSVHILLEEQAEKTPDNIAVIFEDQQLTYQQLNAKANQLAYYLRERGVKPDTLVAIAVERSLEMIVGILGILKAGGAYVPIDPSYPPVRIRLILEDTQVSILLTQENIFERLPVTGAEVFLLDKEQKKLIKYPITNPSPVTQPHHLAYVIYTSGSTGKPKGVLGIHQGAVNRLLWMKEYCNLTEADCILQKTPYTFDVSVWELLLSFLGGACLVFAKPGGHKDPHYLREVIRQKSVTLMHFVPSMLDAFLLPDKTGDYSSLRCIITSGEALSILLKDRFFEGFPLVELHNLYGPTEASIDVTFWDCSSNTHPRIVPIGKPIWNTSLYILDSSLSLAPIGVLGELYIGGDGLARGYLNRPELTAERFIKNPFQTEEEKQDKNYGKFGRNARLYKTGDLCRWLEDGNIEFLGRLDDQVKIRGFRIELGEIEAAILQYFLVKEAIVIVREDTPGDKRLVGYLVFKKDKDNYKDKDKGKNGDKDRDKERDRTIVEMAELRTHLQDTLPEYMIPSKLVRLRRLPLTANGKVDRAKLSKLKQISETERHDLAIPCVTFESRITKIWSKILGLEKIDIKRNFFELGGNSLLAIKVINMLNQEFSCRFTPVTLFIYPTVKQLASYLNQGVQK